MIKNIILFMIISLLSYSQDNQQNEIDNKTIENWKSSLSYGIPEDVSKTIKEIIKAKDNSLESLIYPLLDNKSSTVITSALDYYKSNENKSAVEKAFEILKNTNSSNTILINSVLQYIEKVKAVSDSNFETLSDIYNSSSVSIQASIIRVIGEGKLQSANQFLLDKFDSLSKSDILLKSEILLSLGKIGSKDNFTFLENVIKESTEDRKVINSAIKAISYYKDDSSFDILKKQLESEDATSRASVYSSLENYPIDRVKPLILDCLRDSYYNSRSNCVENVKKQKIKDAVPYLIHMAKKDPMPELRKQAVISLLEMDSIKEITELISDKELLAGDKENIVMLMLSKDYISSSIPVLLSLIDKESQDKTSAVIFTIAKQSSKITNKDIYQIYEKIMDVGNTISIIQVCEGIKKNKFTQAVEKLNSLLSRKQPTLTDSVNSTLKALNENK